MLVLFSTKIVFSQQTTPWPLVSTPNSIQSGYVGIGTKSTTTNTNTPLPNFNLHLHGTVDYTEPLNPTGPSGLVLYDKEQNSETFTTKSTINFGKTVRLGLTNTTTGMNSTDGGVFRMSGNDLSIINQESGLLNLNVPGIGLTIASSSKRFWINNSSLHNNPNSTNAIEARFNIISQGDNGLYIRNISSGKYGLFLKVASNTDNALQIQGPTTNTFIVKGNGSTELSSTSTDNLEKIFLIKNTNRKLLQLTNDGILRTREIIVDQVNWPDYVFEKEYILMPLSEVDDFIKQNGHLPNVPKAEIIESEGLALGEMNKILMEKVEELTLYLLEQNKKLEEQEKRIAEMEMNLNSKK